MAKRLIVLMVVSFWTAQGLAGKLENTCKYWIHKLEQIQAASARDVLEYSTLATRFRAIEFESDASAWAERAFILEALDQLRATAPAEKAAKEMLPLLVGGTASKAGECCTIPVLPMANLPLYLDRREGLDADVLEQEHLRKHFESIVHDEPMAYVSLVKLTTATGWNPLQLGSADLITRRITRYLGREYHQTFANPQEACAAIAKFSAKVSIPSGSIIALTPNSDDVYFGAKHVFGKRFEQYKSVNEWFGRQKVSTFHQGDLEKAIKLEQTLEEARGPAHASRVVIASAYAKVRIRSLLPGQVNQPQKITGKILNTEAATSNQRNSKYAFYVKNLFGWDDRSTAPLRVSERRMQGPSVKEDDVHWAQAALLAQMYNMLERSGAVQVVQRLAPSDLHYFVSPVAGRALPQSELADFLSTLSGDPEEKQRLQQVKNIVTQFAAERKTQLPSLIGIYGTNMSVSTPALQERSDILAQNDRKILLLQHPDHSYSVHVFIGATGVNSVVVHDTSAGVPQGKLQGAMYFGPDCLWTDVLTAGLSECDEHNITPGLRKLPQGQKLGVFPVGGSTVISYYLPDFVPLPEIAKFLQTSAVLNPDGEGIDEIELKVNLGEPLLTRER